MKRRGKLEQEAADFFPEGGYDPVKTVQGISDIPKSLDVSDKTTGLDGESKILGSLAVPLLKGRGPGLPVEGGIDFNGVKDGGQIIKPPAFRKVRGIKVSLPVIVMPSRCSDIGLHHRKRL